MWPNARIEPIVPPAAAASAVAHTIEGEIGAVMLSAAAEVTASATVANRFAAVEIRDQSDRLVHRALSAQAIAAGETWQIVAAVDAHPIDHAAASTIVLRLPELPLEPGWTASVLLLDADAGDRIADAILVLAYAPPTWDELAREEYAEEGVHLTGPRARRRPPG